MTLNLSHKEMDAVNHMASSSDLNKTALIKQALRFYQHVSAKQREGFKMAWIDPKTGLPERVEVFGCGDPG
jgi:hypothetical protein